MDLSSHPASNQSNELRSETELPNPPTNELLVDLFGISFVENSPMPPNETGTFNPPPEVPLQGLFGGSSVDNEDILLEKLQEGNQPEAEFFVATGSFQPEGNDPPQVELPEQVEPVQRTDGDLVNMMNNALESVQQVLNASPSPQVSSRRTMNACIADPRDPLQQVSRPRVIPPVWTTAPAMRRGRNTVAHSSELSDETRLQYGNNEESGRPRSSLKRARATNSRSILSNEDDHISSDEAMHNSNSVEDYQASDEDGQASETSGERDSSTENQAICCPICKLKLGDKDALRRHQTRAHRSTEKKIRCDNCNGLFANEVNLQRHINNVHTGEQKYACKLCTATFSTERSLYNHRGKQHRDVPAELGGPKRKKRKRTDTVYKCSLCTYSSNQQFNVRRHFGIVHEKKSFFQCLNRGCGRICMSKANYKTHIMTCRKRPNK